MPTYVSLENQTEQESSQMTHFAKGAQLFITCSHLIHGHNSCFFRHIDTV